MCPCAYKKMGYDLQWHMLAQQCAEHGRAPVSLGVGRSRMQPVPCVGRHDLQPSCTAKRLVAKVGAAGHQWPGKRLRFANGSAQRSSRAVRPAAASEPSARIQPPPSVLVRCVARCPCAATRRVASRVLGKLARSPSNRPNTACPTNKVRSCKRSAAAI